MVSIEENRQLDAANYDLGHLARSSPPSTSNHAPTAHESRRRAVAWLGQAVRWSGSGAGPTGCHQASGGGCSGLPQPVMNSTCGCGRRCGGLLRSESAAEHFFIWIAYPLHSGAAGAARGVGAPLELFGLPTPACWIGSTAARAAAGARVRRLAFHWQMRALPGARRLIAQCSVLAAAASSSAATEPAVSSSWPLSSCRGTLGSVCPLGGGGTMRQCDDCVGVHQAALRRAGCTSAQVQAWCAGGLGPAGVGDLYDSFLTYNTSIWTYDDRKMGTTNKCKVWYLKNHSQVGAQLSLGEGKGLRMLMSSTPCKANPGACHGAKMAADHVGSLSKHLYGDYELRMRAPYAVNGALRAGGDHGIAEI
jgi:hypothetical protein